MNIITLKIQKTTGLGDKRMDITKKEAKYYTQKGTIERNFGKDHTESLKKFNKKEAQVFFGMDEENYNRLTKEQKRAMEKRREDEKNPGEKEEKDAPKIYKKAYERIKILLEKYLDMPEEYYHLITIWILGTYIHESFDTYPYLFINAMRGSGKTRLLRLISSLSKGSEGRVNTGITESVLFRTEKGSTLILDECEGISNKEKATLREYLNACYKKGATVSRTKKVKNKDGENYEIEMFEPFRPISMANISGMEEVLGDRCLTLILEKSNNPGKTKKIEDFDRLSEISDLKLVLTGSLCSLCSVVTKKNIITAWNDFIDNKYNYITTLTTNTTLTTLTTLPKDLIDFYNKIDKLDIDGRNLELLFPLIVVSKLLSNELLDKTLKVGKEIIEIKKGEEFTESKDVNLIDFVSTLTQSRFDFLYIKDLTREFKVFLGETDDDEKWLNGKWIGRALMRLKLVTEKKREAKGITVRLAIDKAKERIKMFKTIEEEDEK